MPKLPLASRPFFVFLLPLFFVVHGFAENAILRPFGIAAILLGSYLALALVLTGIFRLLFRNTMKAALLTTAVLAIQFFFGAIKDAIAGFSGFLSGYTVLLPLLLLLLVLFITWLRRQSEFGRLSSYLNILLLLLILIDTGMASLAAQKTPMGAAAPVLQKLGEGMDRPDIYLIIADEYAGHEQLQEQFAFDNSPFEDSLRNRGFAVLANTRSNYNFTVYSMASLLNMNYLEGNYQASSINHRDIFAAMDLIDRSAVADYLQEQGYRVENLSIFPFAGIKPAMESRFFPPLRAFFTAQTLTERLEYDLGARFASSSKIDDLVYENVRINQSLIDGTEKIAQTPSDQPRFVYTHLLLPHHPYFFNRNGKAVPRQQLGDEHKSDTAAYREYLLYSNTRLLALVDQIRKGAKKPPVILLLSDHGFHQFRQPVPERYAFMNLNAVLLPPNYRSDFRNGMTSVNEFRVLFNTLFQQRLPLLPDSTHYLKEAEGITPQKFHGD